MHVAEILVKWLILLNLLKENSMKGTLTSVLLLGVFSAPVAAQDAQQIYDDVAQQAALQTALNRPTVNVGGFIQTGWEYSNGGGVSTENGFFVERARINISGDLANETLSYLVSGEWDTSNNFNLLDAYVDFKLFNIGSIDTGAFVRLGQFVPDFYGGFVDDPTKLTTYNYSVSALTFGQGRGQGVQFSRAFGENLRASAFYNNGFDNLSGPGDNNYAVGGSLHYHIGFDLNLNAGYAYSDSGSEATNSYTLGADWAYDRFTLDLDWIQNDASGSWDNWSLVSTVSYEIESDLEAFLQWEYGEYEGDLNLLTLGANYELNSAMTWTNSFGYSIQDLGSNFNTDNTGWRSGAGDGQYVIRSVVTFSF